MYPFSTKKSLCIWSVLLLSSFAQAQSGKPDLVITDIWLNNGLISYQIMNIGDAVAPGIHSSALWVENTHVENKAVSVDLQPGEGKAFFFSYQWQCTPGSDGIVVIADTLSNIFEADENNNTLQENWKCDITKPQIISGPNLSGLSVSEVKITWNTDELSTSKVMYSNKAGLLDLEEEDLALATLHVINLSMLLPGTTYHFIVSSSDASGNEVQSTQVYFTTAYENDPNPPQIAQFTMNSSKLPMQFHADAFDDKGIDRVAFFLDGSPLETDHVAPFHCTIDPDDLGLTSSQFFINHQILARAYDAGGLFVESTVSMSPIRHCFPSEYDYVSPRENYPVVIDGTNVPGGSPPLNIYATATSTPYIEHVNRWGFTVIQGEPIEKMVIYIDGTPIHSVSNTTLLDYDWNIDGLAVGDYEVRILFYDGNDCTPAGETHTVSIFNPHSDLHIESRSVHRSDQLLSVVVTVRNEGHLAAELTSFMDSVCGFGVIPRDTGAYTIASVYNPHSKTSAVTLSFPPGFTVNPFSSRAFSYQLVPIMFNGFDDYTVGITPMHLNIINSSGDDVFLEETMPHEGSTLEEKVSDAFRFSDYLIITNPHALTGKNTVTDVQILLGKMSELASLRNGVLAYFNGYGTLRTAYRTNYKADMGTLFRAAWDQEIFIADAGADRIRSYDKKGHLTLNNSELPIEHVGLSTSDGFAVGNIESTHGGMNHPEPEIIVADGEGTSVGSVTSYKYYATSQFFSPYYVTTEYEAGDAFITGDTMDMTPFDEDELIVGKNDGTLYTYYSHATTEASFPSVFNHGDFLCTGNILGDAQDEIIVGDVSTNRLFIYDGSGTLLLFHDLPGIFAIESTDSMAIGDVHNCAFEEIVIADHSADRVHAYRYRATTSTLVPSGLFNISFSSGDKLLVDDMHDAEKSELIFLRAQTSHHYVAGDVDIMSFPTGNLPGDRHHLDELINPGGEWASKLTSDWLSEGYLLFVGEIEIIPAFSCSYELGSSVKKIEYTDNYYTNTVDSLKKPELSGGRIIGNNAVTMTNTIQRTIDIINGDTEFDRSDALVVSGRNDGVSGEATWINFTLERWGVTERLETTGYNVSEQEDPSETSFFNAAENKDVIHLAGHGSKEAWDNLSSSEILAGFDPDTSSPLVYGDSCLTGRYPFSADTVAEQFLKNGASAYIGATEIAHFPYSKYLAYGFYDRFDVGYPAGKALKVSKRVRMGTKNYAKYNSAIYHLFGDPKLEPVVAKKNAQPHKTLDRLLAGPLAAVQVTIPDYVLIPGETDSISIPGGAECLVSGYPAVPSYIVNISFPQGDCVQNVTLTQKSNISFLSNLNLETVDDAVMSDNQANRVTASQEASTWPELDFEWERIPNPDGSSTLAIHIYPLRYNAITDEALYVQAYDFDVDFSSDTIEIKELRMGKKVYRLDEDITTNIFVANKGQDQDILVETTIKTMDGAFVASHPIHKLLSVGILASLSQSWDSTGTEAGHYAVEIALKQTDGVLLDSEMRYFSIGNSSTMISDFQISPTCFGIGEQVNIQSSLLNTGDGSQSGTLFIAVQEFDGTPITSFTQDILNLSPGGTTTLNAVWQNATQPTGKCRIMTYAVYDGTTTLTHQIDERQLSLFSGSVTGWPAQQDVRSLIETLFCVGP